MDLDSTCPNLKLPGLRWRRQAHGWAATWQCREDIAAKGYKPVSERIAVVEGYLSSKEIEYIEGRCGRLQAAMVTWAKGGVPLVGAGMYDGSWASLASNYRSDPMSPFHKQRFASRRNAESIIGVFVRDYGNRYVEDFTGRDAYEWHARWMSERGVSMAHSLMGKVRTLLTYGKTLLNDAVCDSKKSLLHDMKFAQGKPRTSSITRDQVLAVVRVAHAKGWHSIAFAQILQFELTLRQKDVIGEWVPVSEPGVSDVIDGVTNKKWMRGLHWKEIDDNLVLKHVTSKRQKEIEIDLHNAPLVMEEMRRIGGPLTDGPLVVSEEHERAYYGHEFRYKWRQCAKAAGVPKSVYNMDTRSGAITEALQAGASLEDVRKTATHSDVSMTQRYSRQEAKATAGVMQRRAQIPNKSGTSDQ